MAKYMPEKRFSFISTATSLDEETFGVVQFSGVEGISIPYEFDIMLVSDNPDIDLDDIMAVPAKFTIHRKEGDDVDFHGILDSFEQLHKYNEYIFYRAHLVPRLWWLSITHHNQVCLNKTVPEIVELALKDSGLSTLDFEFKIRGTYNPIDYVCQYNESHFNFISRWLEREGMYYYFDQKGAVEKIIFTDTHIAHTDLPDVHYAPPSGLVETESTEIIHSFICRQRQLPQKIYLKDHNYERPSLGISGSADVDERGRGTDYIYGEYFPNPEEGNRLAGIRAEILNCRKREFVGESTVPFLEPGYTFMLHRHYRGSFNQRYLVENVSHDGNQVGYLIPGILEGLPGHKHSVYYRNNFTAIPADIQFRPERKAVKPRIAGTLHAVIDAEGSGKYAELDDQGRYKVRLPFDESDEHRDGKASAYLRMMQPYANQSGGMQFPLTKGTEVLLTFIDGDPDRPVIAGAVANPETPSPVTAANQTESVIHTGGNNKIRIEDKAGKERIIMESPSANSYVRIGAPNDPIQLNGDNPMYLKQGDTWSDPGATCGRALVSAGTGSVDTSTVGTYTITYTATDTDGVEQTAQRQVIVYDPHIQDFDPTPNGVRIRSDGNLWIEARQRYGEYRVGVPTDTPEETDSSKPTKIKNMLNNFKNRYNPRGLLSRHLKDNSQNALAETFSDAFDKGHVRVSSLDTFITQEGNIYDFGGYWNYNLGNCYIENHQNQQAALNAKEDIKIPATAASVVAPSMLSGMLGGVITTSIASLTVGAIVGGPAGALMGILVGVIGGLVIGVVSGAWYMIYPGEPGQKDLSDTVAGPNHGTIKTWAQKVKSSFIDPHDATKGQAANCKGTEFMHTDTTWVEKKFGDSYDFRKGNSIDIYHGNKEEHNHGDSYSFKYGGRTEETSFTSKGVKKYYLSSGGGIKEEFNYHPINGQLLKYNYTNKNVMFDYELVLPASPKLSIATTFAPMETNLKVSTSMQVNLQGSLGLAMDVKLGTGFKIEVEYCPSWKLEWNWDQMKFILKGPKTQFQKNADINADLQKILLSQMKLDIQSGDMKIHDDKLEVAVKKLKVGQGFEFTGN